MLVTCFISVPNFGYLRVLRWHFHSRFKYISSIKFWLVSETTKHDFRWSIAIASSIPIGSLHICFVINPTSASAISNCTWVATGIYSSFALLLFQCFALFSTRWVTWSFALVGPNVLPSSDMRHIASISFVSLEPSFGPSFPDLWRPVWWAKVLV